MENDRLYPVKAKLVNIDQPGLDIVFQFNPKEIRISREVSWGKTPQRPEKGNAGTGNGHAPQHFGPVSPDTGVSLPSYQSTAPYDVSINNILFDTFESRSSVDYYINQLKQTVTPIIPIGADGERSATGTRKRPPTYIFTFGNRKFDFICAVTSLAWIYSVWLPDGTPLRALVNLRLKETTLKLSKNVDLGSQNAIRTGSTFSIGNSLSAGAELSASASLDGTFSLSADLSGFI